VIGPCSCTHEAVCGCDAWMTNHPPGFTYDSLLIDGSSNPCSSSLCHAACLSIHPGGGGGGGGFQQVAVHVWRLVLGYVKLCLFVHLTHLALPNIIRLYQLLSPKHLSTPDTCRISFSHGYAPDMLPPLLPPAFAPAPVSGMVSSCREHPAC